MCFSLLIEIEGLFFVDAILKSTSSKMHHLSLFSLLRKETISNCASRSSQMSCLFYHVGIVSPHRINDTRNLYRFMSIVLSTLSRCEERSIAARCRVLSIGETDFINLVRKPGSSPACSAQKSTTRFYDCFSHDWLLLPLKRVMNFASQRVAR